MVTSLQILPGCLSRQIALIGSSGLGKAAAGRRARCTTKAGGTRIPLPAGGSQRGKQNILAMPRLAQSPLRVFDHVDKKQGQG